MAHDSRWQQALFDTGRIVLGTIFRTHDRVSPVYAAAQKPGEGMSGRALARVQVRLTSG